MIIEIAGIRIKVNHGYHYLKELCAFYIVAGEDYDFEISISSEDMERERKKSEELTGKSLFPGACESIAVYRKICEKIVEYDCFRIHGAAVSVDGKGYIFAGESGCGKSTQAKLWLQYFGNRGFMINGDKPIIRKMNGIYQICGTPWNGKEGLGTNTQLPVKAIFFLEQAKENSVAPIDAVDAASQIMAQNMRPQNTSHLKKYIQMASALVTEVPCYRLKCNRKPEAVETAWNAVNGMK